MPRIALAPEFGESPIPNFGTPTVLNMYPELVQGKGLFPLVGDQGKVSRAECGAPGRGQFYHLGVHYAVGGQTLYRVSSDWGLTALGTIPGTQPVRFAANASQIAILGDGALYVMSSAGVFGAVTDSDFPGARDIACLNNIGVFVQANDTGRWGATRAGDFRDIDALDVATAESNADPLVGVEVSNNSLVFPGSRSTEIWAAGDGRPPFTRLAALDIGCVARDTIAHHDGTLVWLAWTRAGSASVMRLAGGSPQRVSTHAVERMIGRAENLSEARAITYVRDGHEFYELILDSGSARFDAQTQLWTQTASGAWAVGNRPPASRFVNCIGRSGVMVWQDASGTLYTATDEDWTDNDATLTRLFRTPVIAGDGKLITINRVELEMEAGRSPLSGELPVLLSMSKDGGHTWPYQREASIGARGKYRWRVSWRGLGQVQNATLEFKFAGNADFRVTGVYADITEDRRV